MHRGWACAPTGGTVLRAMRQVAAIALSCAMPSTVDAAAATEFWAVHVQDVNITLSMILVVGNPDPSRPASVTIENSSGLVSSATVAPGSSHVFDLGFAQRYHAQRWCAMPTGSGAMSRSRPIKPGTY